MKIWWLPQRQWPSRRRRRQQQQSSSSILSAFQFEGFTVALLPASIWLTHHQRAEIRPCCCIPSSASHYENSSALQTCTTYGPLSSLCGPWRLFGNNIYFKELAIFFFLQSTFFSNDNLEDISKTSHFIRQPVTENIRNIWSHVCKVIKKNTNILFSTKHIVLRRFIIKNKSNEKFILRGSYRKSWATIFCKVTCFIIDKPNTPP